MPETPPSPPAPPAPPPPATAETFIIDGETITLTPEQVRAAARKGLAALKQEQERPNEPEPEPEATPTIKPNDVTASIKELTEVIKNDIKERNDKETAASIRATATAFKTSLDSLIKDHPVLADRKDLADVIRVSTLTELAKDTSRPIEEVFKKTIKPFDEVLKDANADYIEKKKKTKEETTTPKGGSGSPPPIEKKDFKSKDLKDGTIRKAAADYMRNAFAKV